MKKFKLLVFIDDDHPTNVFHKIVVEESNLCEEALFFTSPLEALKYFERLCKEASPVLPDAIFLDINMPQLNGWQFIQAYQKLGIRESPVIIMLTTSLYTQDVAKAEELDIVHKLINKPLETSHLRALTEELQFING
ncbi:MAG: response regulator [Bacteroidota bacterium]